MNKIRVISYDTKILKDKKLGKDLTLKVIQHSTNGRIFVEFISNDGKLVLQKSFQNTYEGEKESLVFQKSMKSIRDLKKYFGLEIK